MRLTRGAHGDSASTTSIAVMIAAAILVGGISMATMMTAKPAGVDPKKAQYETEATTALDVIVRDTGRTSAGLSSWSQNADVLTRFGLAMKGQPNFIDYQKVKSLRNGTLIANATNKAPDYPEVKSALNIKDGDFHLRTYPVLPGVDDPRWTIDDVGALAFVGNFTGASAPVNITASYVKNATMLNVTVNVSNVGSRPAIFDVNIAITQKSTNRTAVDEDRHTRLLDPGENQTIWVTFDQLEWGTQTGEHYGNHEDFPTDSVRIDVTDPYQLPGRDQNGVLVGPVWLTVTPPIGTLYTYGLSLSADHFYAVSGGNVSFTLDRYDNAGGPVPGSARFVLRGPNGAEWTNQTVSWPAASTPAFVYVCPNCTASGLYTAIAYDSNLYRRIQDVMYVSSVPLFTEKSVESALSLNETVLLQKLVRGFAGTTYDATTNPDGDVFQDDSNGGINLAAKLSRFTTLVIGSEVSQNALAPNAIRNNIAAWVATGGNLIVLGTNTQASTWLQPIYYASQNNANGGISAPDPTHPIIVTPNHLAYDRYLDRGRAWGILSSQPFTHVLTRGSAGGSSEDTLAVNNPGGVGNGSLVLTSYMPGALTQPMDDKEALRFLQNLLAQRFNMLFMDFGPSIPGGVSVGSDQRLVAVAHPNVPGAVVEVKLVMYMFG